MNFYQNSLIECYQYTHLDDIIHDLLNDLHNQTLTFKLDIETDSLAR